MFLDNSVQRWSFCAIWLDVIHIFFFINYEFCISSDLSSDLYELRRFIQMGNGSVVFCCTVLGKSKQLNGFLILNPLRIYSLKKGRKWTTPFWKVIDRWFCLICFEQNTLPVFSFEWNYILAAWNLIYKLLLKF